MARRIVDSVLIQSQNRPDKIIIEKIPLLHKILLGALQASTSSVLIFVHVYVVTYFESVGLKLSTLAFFTSISACFDLCLDPFFSQRSIVAGNTSKKSVFAVVTWMAFVAVTALLFSPQKGLERSSLNNWFGGSYIAFMIIYSYLLLPYHSLVPDVVNNCSGTDKIVTQMIMGMCEYSGLFILFLFCGMFASMNSLTSGSCHVDSCYSAEGIGRAGLPDPVNGKRSSFAIFNTTLWGLSTPFPNMENTCRYYDRQIWSDPEKIYTQKNCHGYAENDFTHSCMNNYCTCIGETRKLCNIENHRDANLSMGLIYGLWTLTAVLLLRRFVLERYELNKVSALPSDNVAALTSENLVLHSPKGSREASARSEGSLSIYTDEDRIKLPTLRIDVPLEDNRKLAEKRRSSTNNAVAPEPKAQPVPIHISSEQETPPLIPALISAMQNRPFRQLLICWVCDTISMLMLLCMMIYYVKYVIQPEYMRKGDDEGYQCNNGIPVTGTDSENWRCNSSTVTGLILSMMMLAAILAAPVWGLVASYIGTVPTWQINSFVNTILICAFAASAIRGRIATAVVMGMCVGAAMGGRFLYDVIMLYVIDYDQYLTGRRNTGIFTMVKSVLLKVCYFPAVIVPVAILHDKGLVNDVHYIVQSQPESVRRLCSVMTVLIPFGLSFVASLLKLKYRLVDPVQFQMMTSGIQEHSVGRAAPDPLSGAPFLALSRKFSSEENWRCAQAFAYFPSVHQIVDFRACVEAELPELGVRLIANKMRDRAGFCALLSLISIIGMGFTSPYFVIGDDNNGKYALPAFLLICFGVFSVLTVFNLIRVGAAYKLYDEDFQPSVQALDTLVEHKASLEAIFNTLPPIKAITNEYLAKVEEARGKQISRLAAKVPTNAEKESNRKDSKKSIVSIATQRPNSLFGGKLRDWGDAQRRKPLGYHKSTENASSLWAKELLSYSFEQMKEEVVSTADYYKRGARPIPPSKKGAKTMLQSELLKEIQSYNADDTDETKSGSDGDAEDSGSDSNVSSGWTGAGIRGRFTTQTMGGSYDFGEQGATPLESRDRCLQLQHGADGSASDDDEEEEEEGVVDKRNAEYAATEKIAFEAADIELQNRNHPHLSADIINAEDNGEEEEERSSMSSDFTISSGTYESD